MCIENFTNIANIKNKSLNIFEKPTSQKNLYYNCPLRRKIISVFLEGEVT